MNIATDERETLDTLALMYYKLKTNIITDTIALPYRTSKIQKKLNFNLK